MISSYMTSYKRICVTFRTSSDQFMVQKAHKVLWKKKADMTVDTSLFPVLLHVFTTIFVSSSVVKLGLISATNIF